MKGITHKRINITLPESTIILLENVANKGERSIFIDSAIRTYIKQIKQNSLRESLKDGSIARSERDLSLSNEWFDVEEELWQN